MCFPVKFAKFFYRTALVASSEHYVLSYDYSENVTDSLTPVGSYNIIFRGPNLVCNLFRLYMFHAYLIILKEQLDLSEFFFSQNLFHSCLVVHVSSNV